MPSGAILKEEGTVPPMPLDAFVKEEVVITKEEEEADVPEPDDPTEEEEAGNRLQQQLDEDKWKCQLISIGTLLISTLLISRRPYAWPLFRTRSSVSRLRRGSAAQWPNS